MKRAELKDYQGKKYNRLIILDLVFKNGHTHAICKCECGNMTELTLYDLKRGTTKSCGCLRKECPHTFKHGKSLTRLNGIWYGMVDRCCNMDNKSYSHYGGRGINICNEWKNDFLVFEKWAYANGYNDNLIIDRINNDGNYEPSNCHWATMVTQCRNRRVSKNSKSGIHGVHFNNSCKRWIARIKCDKKEIYLGSFICIDDAVKARKEAELKYWGDEK